MYLRLPLTTMHFSADVFTFALSTSDFRKGREARGLTVVLSWAEDRHSIGFAVNRFGAKLYRD